MIEREERDTLAFLDQIDAEVQAWARESKFDQRADLWERVRDGDQWKGQDGPPIFAANLAGNYVERKVAQLAQSKPDIRIIARSAQLAEPANILTQTSRAVLDENDFDARIERGADLGATYGFCGVNTAWDPNGDYGDGNIVTRIIHPRHLGVDPRVLDTTEMRKASYVFIDTPMSLDDVRLAWPGRGALVLPDKRLSAYETPGQTTWSWWGGKSQTLKAQRSIESPYPYALVREYWLRDSRLDPESGQPLFPTGRVIHRAGQVILDDGPNPYWDGEWPLDVWDWRLDANSFAGRSEIEALRKLQEAFGRFGDTLTKNALLHAVITIIGDANALTPQDWAKLDNRVARIVKTAPGKRFEIKDPPEIPASYFMLLEKFPDLMETLIGVPKASQGRRQEGVVAASAVEGLQTAAEVLVRSAARRLEYVIERVGQKMVSRIIQFYTADRVLSLLGPGGEWQSWTFERAKLLADGLPEKERRAYFTNFRFRVTPLSSLPQNKTQRALMAMELQKAGLIPGIEVLRQAEYPNYEELYATAKKEQEESAKAAQEQMKEAALMGVPPAALKAFTTPTGGGAKSNRAGTRLGFGG